MSHESSRAATRSIARPPLWGVYRYDTPAGGMDYPLSYDDHERDVAWAATFLGDFEVGRGSAVCFVGQGNRGAWLQPIMEAAKRMGALASYAGDWPTESSRVAAVIRRLNPSLFVGLSPGVAERLLEEEDCASALASAHLLLDSSAARVFGAAGIRAGTMEFVGPATALSCYEGAVHVNTSEWEFTTNGSLAITTHGPRAHEVAGLPLGIEAQIGSARCLCGRSDPPLVLS